MRPHGEGGTSQGAQQEHEQQELPGGQRRRPPARQPHPLRTITVTPLVSVPNGVVVVLLGKQSRLNRQQHVCSPSGAFLCETRPRLFLCAMTNFLSFLWATLQHTTLEV